MALVLLLLRKRDGAGQQSTVYRMDGTMDDTIDGTMEDTVGGTLDVGQ